MLLRTFASEAASSTASAVPPRPGSGKPPKMLSPATAPPQTTTNARPTPPRPRPPPPSDLEKPLPRWRRRLVKLSSQGFCGAILRAVGFWAPRVEGLEHWEEGKRFGAVGRASGKAGAAPRGGAPEGRQPLGRKEATKRGAAGGGDDQDRTKKRPSKAALRGLPGRGLFANAQPPDSRRRPCRRPPPAPTAFAHRLCPGPHASHPRSAFSTT